MHTTVLWPTDIPTHHNEGICYGWTQPLLCVAGILSASTHLEAEQLLQSALTHSRWVTVRKTFSSEPKILGYLSGSPYDDPSNVTFMPDICISDSLQFVLYRRYKRQSMRFYCFDFNELDILPSQNSTNPAPRTLEKVINDTLAADFTRTHNPADWKGNMFDGEVLSQINLAQFLASIVEGETFEKHNINISSPSPGIPDLNYQKPAASSNEKHLSTSSVQRAIGMLYSVARMFSTTAEQFDVRYEQGVYVFGEVPYVYRDKARTVKSISKYIKFHNCLWLVLNDVIIGIAFGSFLCENQHFFARWLHHSLQTYLIDGMQRALLWLNNWPAGLKLNTELSQFYCHTLVGVVSAWGWLLNHAAPYFPSLIWIIGVGGCCGMTMIVSLLSDTLSLLTAHLYVCYYLAATVFSQQLSLAGSLWNLFRGKRYNVLRNRIDKWDYDLDQLLLGTILFTLLAFLYPTVLTYYALFATARLSVIIIHAVFDTVTALLNHFPLFALLLRVKDPLRLPGGVCIQRSREGPLILSSQSASLSSIFRHYAHLGYRLTTHYHPLRMLRQLASGRLLNPIPRASIRYSMIPAKDSIRRER